MMWDPRLDAPTDEIEKVPAHAAEVVYANDCCPSHRVFQCCDPMDCGPCCNDCPSCPQLIMSRAYEKAAANAPNLRCFYVGEYREIAHTMQLNGVPPEMIWDLLQRAYHSALQDGGWNAAR